MTNKSGSSISSWFSKTGVDLAKVKLNAADSLAANSSTPQPFSYAPARREWAEQLVQGFMAANQSAITL